MLNIHFSLVSVSVESMQTQYFKPFRMYPRVKTLSPKIIIAAQGSTYVAKKSLLNAVAKVIYRS